MLFSPPLREMYNVMRPLFLSPLRGCEGERKSGLLFAKRGEELSSFFWFAKISCSAQKEAAFFLR